MPYTVTDTPAWAERNTKSKEQVFAEDRETRVAHFANDLMLNRKLDAATAFQMADTFYAEKDRRSKAVEEKFAKPPEPKPAVTTAHTKVMYAIADLEEAMRDIGNNSHPKEYLRRVHSHLHDLLRDEFHK